MRKSFKWLIVTGAAGLLLIAIAVPALAANPNVTAGDTPALTQRAGNGFGNFNSMGNGISESVTGLLGLTAEEIRELRQEGKSLVEIAAGQNIQEEELINAIMADKKAALDKMVEEGTLTQELADQRLAQMRERVELAINRTTTGAPEWAGAGGKGQKNSGGMNTMGNGSRGKGLRGNQENCTGVPGTCTGSGRMTGSGRTTN